LDAGGFAAAEVRGLGAAWSLAVAALGAVLLDVVHRVGELLEALAKVLGETGVSNSRVSSSESPPPSVSESVADGSCGLSASISWAVAASR
jgi:hypothetical protein